MIKTGVMVVVIVVVVVVVGYDVVVVVVVVVVTAASDPALVAYILTFFRCVLAPLHEGGCVRPSVCPSIRLSI